MTLDYYKLSSYENHAKQNYSLLISLPTFLGMIDRAQDLFNMRKCFRKFSKFLNWTV